MSLFIFSSLLVVLLLTHSSSAFFWFDIFEPLYEMDEWKNSFADANSLAAQAPPTPAQAQSWTTQSPVWTMQEPVWTTRAQGDGADIAGRAQASAEQTSPPEQATETPAEVETSTVSATQDVSNVTKPKD